MRSLGHILKKAGEARMHPGISKSASIPALARQGLPYISSIPGRARPPITLYWNVNSVCNLRCKMCDVGTFNEESNFFKNLRIDRKLHEIDPEVFDSVIQEVRAFGPTISINGTEPLMYKPLGDIVARTRRAGLEIAVTTGAYNLEERAQELADIGLTRLNVSIDGAPQMHDRIRGRAGVFERATEGLKLFHDASRKRGNTPEILVNFTVSNINHAHLVEAVEALLPLPIDRINVVNMNFVTKDMANEHNALWRSKYRATENCISEEVQPGKVDTDVLFEQACEARARGNGRVVFLPWFERDELARYYHEPSEFVGSIPCMSSWFVAQIMADGEVIPYTRCYHVPFGNINERPFLEVWNGAAARAWRRDLRRQGRFPACTRCDMAY